MEYYAIKGHANTDMEAISLCADELYKEGCVTENFKQNCITRERSYPTGLPSAIPVAMPHSEISGVKREAICMLILDEPVTFRRMDDDSQQIQAKMVFNLACADPSGHMYVLRNLMQVFYSEDELNDLYNSKLEDLPGKLASYLDKDE